MQLSGRCLNPGASVTGGAKFNSSIPVDAQTDRGNEGKLTGSIRCYNVHSRIQAVFVVSPLREAPARPVDNTGPRQR